MSGCTMQLLLELGRIGHLLNALLQVDLTMQCMEGDSVPLHIAWG